MPGYAYFPHCQLCTCDLRGVTDEICDQETQTVSAKKMCEEKVVTSVLLTPSILKRVILMAVPNVSVSELLIVVDHQRCSNRLSPI